MVSGESGSLSFGLGPIAERKVSFLETCLENRSESLRIIDLGGGKEKHFPQKSQIVDTVVDIKAFDDASEYRNFITGDLNSPSLFRDLEEIVSRDGKFDYALCTHTLEDIRNPQLTLEFLPKIAKAGLLSFPSKYLELQKFEAPTSVRGFHHHRWIFTVDRGTLVLVPKVNLLEDKIFNPVARKYHDGIGELWLEWADHVPFRTLGNDFIGPGYRKALSLLSQGLVESDEDLFVKDHFKTSSRYVRQMKLGHMRAWLFGLISRSSPTLD